MFDLDQGFQRLSRQLSICQILFIPRKGASVELLRGRTVGIIKDRHAPFGILSAFVRVVRCVSGGSTMTRYLFLAIAVIGAGVLLYSPADAVTPLQCEERAATCMGVCR